MQNNQDGIDYDDPRSIAERRELEDAREANGTTDEDFATALGQILSFMIDGGSLASVGLRVLIVAKKLRPDRVHGMSLEDIAGQGGFGRSMAHKLSKEFEEMWGIFGPHDKSQKAREAYAIAWHKTNRGTAGGAE